MTEYNNEQNIICPYCNYEDKDSWEVQESDEEYECGSCGKKFVLEVEHNITYSTIKTSCEDNKHKFKKKPSAYWITDGKWDFKTDIKNLLPKEEWMYNERYRCENCDESKYIEITEEEFAEKYPNIYEITLNHHGIKMEDKKNGK